MGASKVAPVKYKILPAGVDDCPALAFIEAVAFNDLVKEQPETNAYRLMFGPASEESQASRCKDFVEKLETDPTSRLWKVVISDADAATREKTIACAIWHFYLDPFTPDDWKDIEWPSFANAQACNEVIGGMMRVKRKHMYGKRFAFLSVVGTLPEYRGQGIASALITHGIDEAVKAGLKDFWLDGSVDGHALYERLGFRDVEDPGIDMTKYGGVSKFSVIGMRKTIP